MRISRKLRIASLVPVTMAVVIGAVFLFSNQRMKEAEVNRQAVRKISNSTAELNSLATEYIFYHTERPKQQFLQLHDLTTRLISDTRFHDKEQQRLYDSIRNNTESIRDFFLKLVSNHDSFGYEKEHAVLRDAEERLAGQIIVKSRQVAADVSRMERLMEADLTAAATRTAALLFYVIATAALSLTLFLLLTARSVTVKLEALRKGTEIVASGDLGYRIGIAEGDEIGDVSRSFDHMTEQLRATTVSRDELSREVKERRSAQEELRAQREWLRITINSIGDAVLATDAEGRVIFMNPIGAALTGWEPEEAEGKPVQSILRIFNEQTGEKAEDIVSLVLNDGKRVALANHTALRARDGREIPIEDSAAPIRDSVGSVIGVVVVFHDVSEKRRAEEALRESEERHRSIFENSLDGIILSFPHGQILAANPSACRMHGYTEEEMRLLGREGITDQSDPRLFQQLEERSRTGRWRGEITHIRKDRTRFPCETSTAVFRDKQGREASVVIIRDITDRKQAEEALRKAHDEMELRVRERTAELERKNKELQEFAFVASHDLNEPLRKIQTFGDLLKAKSELRLSEQERDYVSRMTGAARRMQELLDALLKYSRIETQGRDFVPVRLDDIARTVQSDLEVSIQKRGARVEIGPLPTIHGDPYQWRQLFQNLIANALKYNRAEVKTIIKIYGTDEGRSIFVEDNGIGFDEKYLDKIFQPFQRLHGKYEYEGTGIGLAICKKIVERHGGTITAKSTPGKGSTFIVTLPKGE